MLIPSACPKEKVSLRLGESQGSLSCRQTSTVTQELSNTSSLGKDFDFDVKASTSSKTSTKTDYMSVLQVRCCISICHRYLTAQRIVGLIIQIL